MHRKQVYKPVHPMDREYFDLYPAPLMEMLHAQHFTNVNATIAFFGPMLYFFARAICAQKVLEIGHAEGYTAFYLANAIRDNGIRFNRLSECMYYGIDIRLGDYVREQLLNLGLPATILDQDSMKLTSRTFPGERFDLIFQDGCHDTEHVLYELETMYPQLKGEGQGFWIFHDCYGPAEEAFHAVEEQIKAGKYNFEYVRIPEIYGIAIMRKMDGYDPKKRYWVG